MELTYVLAWVVCFAIQIKPTEWLLKQFIKDEEVGGVGIFVYLGVLPFTSSIGASWMIETFA